jgi:predicted ester cyclase
MKTARPSLPQTEKKSGEKDDRHLLEETDRGNLNVVDEYYASDYIDHSPSPLRQLAPGLDGIKHAFQLLYKAFPDTAYRIDDLITEGDRVVVRILATATHTGEIFGMQSTGKEVKLSAIVIFRVVDGKIVERRVAQQGPGVFQQFDTEIPAFDSMIK